MILRNVSSRTVSLRDVADTVYTVPAYGELTVLDNLWTDNTFRRWLHWRIRDIVVVPTTEVTSGVGVNEPLVTTIASGNLSNETTIGTLITKGTIGTRPAASINGRLYYVTDSGQQRITRDTGSAWEDLQYDWTQILNKPGASAPLAHQSSHQTGQSDALTGNVDAIAKTTVRKNTGSDVGSRRRLNLIEGSGITLTVADDAANEEIDVTVTNSMVIPPSGADLVNIDIRNPQQYANQGNSYFYTLSLSQWEAQVAVFGTTPSTFYGVARVPGNLTPPANPQIILELMAGGAGNATIQVSAQRVPNGNSLNPGSFAASQSQTFNSGGSWLLGRTTFTPTWTLSPADLVLFTISRTAAGTLSSNAVYMLGAYLQVQ